MVTARDHEIFSCTSEMAATCAVFDWSTTCLGPVDGWSQGLQTATAILLRSGFPMCLSWGEDLVLLYNDAFIPTLGAKHPTALGAEIAVVFAEIWDQVGPLQRSVLSGGDAVFHEQLPLVLERGSGPEERFFTFSYSHVPDVGRGGGPGGVLAVVSDSTRAVVGARRMGLLRTLATATSEVTDRRVAATTSLSVLSDASSELDHGACYLPGADRRLDLAGSFGAGRTWPESIDPGADEAVERVQASGRALVETLPKTHDGARVRVSVPLRVGSPDPGVLVLAPHPLRPLDERHHRFLRLVADHVGQVLAVASARADEQTRLALLAAADRAKSTFLSNISHEFRTPLTLLLGPLEEALGDGRPLDPTDLTSMHQSAQRLLGMVDALLAAAQGDASPRPAAPEAVDVVGLSDGLLQPFRDAADRAGLALSIRLDPALPIVELDPGLWETIVLNLVANALKYTMEGRVEVVLGAHDGALVLQVRDTGIGIAADEQARVFERFHRVAGPAGRTIEGVGLGLALVTDAVHAHGGTVSLTSTPGEGSTFVVSLPLVEAAASATARVRFDAAAAAALAGHAVPADAVPAVVDHDHPGPFVVVVDDNAGMRHHLVRSLSGLGHVVACVDGVEALALLRRRKPDLVVTDVTMPRLDGIGLLREIRADPDLAATPVVLLSARAGGDAATQALDTGADDYVVKPFTRDELVARCRTTIELAALRASRSAEAARATMLAGISHDMQTPVSVVSASLQMLRDADLDAEQRRELLRRASSRTAQLAQLVAQFLDWSRLSAGVEIAPRAEHVHLAELLDAVAREHDRARLSATAASSTRVVVCDRARTERILHNLLDNARVAARERLLVEVVELDRQVEVHVVDDGPGVDDRVRPWLFAAFGPPGRITGTGLGLHVSRAAARAQGGDLVLADTGPSGSRFVLRLPSAGA
ncbi:ATP-binding protein [Nocardioides sp. 1609]|uniref:ATP-binding response regulator n=1 Tax=Nocardioides sp. 1609 TaxID=2508327 RepID=UPI00107051F2|nr:ATP-binding protein [Nocardioides sp. 1609]